MLRSLNSGVSGIQQFQQEMDVISNNIANSNTVGFKSARVDFADAFSQTLRGSSGGNGTVSGTPAIQIGSGVITDGITNIYTQGSLARTGFLTDLAVSGDGFFIVRDPVSQTDFATRAGDFRLDANGYLTNNVGLHVQGFSDSALSTRGDIKVDDTGRPATADPNATFVSFSISSEGMVKVRLSDGSEYTRGQILLQRFSDPQALTKEGLNLFSGIGAAGPLGGATAPTSAAPGSNGLGKIESGALELSNVDLANEFSTMIATQRGFQASARIITTSDEMLQELVNLKR
jgi:flagellar hook protein FlgE